jgi:predicted amidohydrolase
MQLAVAQAPVELGDVNANLATSRKLLEQAQSACDGGLDLLVLPELFLTGYLLRDDYARVAEAVPGDGPAQVGLAALATESGVHIAAGLVERGRESLYNVALLVGPDGYIGHYRKRYLPNFGPFEEKLHFGAGDATPVFETPLGRIGMQVCYDIFFPTQSLALTRAGASSAKRPHSNRESRWRKSTSGHCRRSAKRDRCCVTLSKRPGTATGRRYTSCT